MAELTGLILPTKELRLSVDSKMKVCAFDSTDVPDWEKFLLDPERDPTAHLDYRVQEKNDCQAFAATLGAEKLVWSITGEKIQFSENCAYSSSEYIDTGGRQINMDAGTSMQAGVQLLTQGIPGICEPGIARRDDWPYRGTYPLSIADFKKKHADCENEAQDAVIEHLRAPEFKTALVGMAIGGALHIGQHWPIYPGKRNVVSKYRNNHGGSGHATEGIHGAKIDGKWCIVVQNSHPRGASCAPYYYYDEQGYQELIEESPFGVYLLLPKDPVKKFYDRQFHIMG